MNTVRLKQAITYLIRDGRVLGYSYGKSGDLLELNLERHKKNKRWPQPLSRGRYAGVAQLVEQLPCQVRLNGLYNVMGYSSIM